MTFDTAVPQRLKTIQCWFGGVISQPLIANDNIAPKAPSGALIEEEACQYIAPSPFLKPHQRIEIYNQQYWWRMCNNLQEFFPLLIRHFQRITFNLNIAIPYLKKYHFNHWSLSYLGDRLPQWIEEEYHEKDKRLVLALAQIDCAYNQCFLAGQNPLIEGDASTLFDQKLSLQPHLFFFAFNHDYFAFREELMQREPQEWMYNELPKLKKLPQRTHFLVYRLFTTNQVTVQKLDPSEHKVLQRFAKGTSVESVCEWLEKLSPNSKTVQHASRNLHLWFQRWIGYQWLSRM